jgi:hypothetical protein
MYFVLSSHRKTTIARTNPPEKLLAEGAGISLAKARYWFAVCSRRHGTKIDVQLQGSGLALKPIVHEIRIQNQVIFLDPPLEYSRQSWIQQLHEWLG